MCSNHPKFDEDLLPEHLGVQFLHYNQGAVRKIIIAEVVDIGIPRNDPPFTVMATGHAICSPLDTYDEQRGKDIATGRAVKQWWKGEQIAKAIQTFQTDVRSYRHGG